MKEISIEKVINKIEGKPDYNAYVLTAWDRNDEVKLITYDLDEAVNEAKKLLDRPDSPKSDKE